MRGRASVSIELSDKERVFLEAQLRRHKAERSLSDRCRIVLRCADGLTSKEVAAELGHAEHTVGKWRRRFAEHRIEGLSDEYRAGRPRSISDAQVAKIIKQTLETIPRDATHWSIRSMAAETGYSHTTIRRIWNAFGLRPHRSETFKLSTDPLFVDKVQDVVGLYELWSELVFRRFESWRCIWLDFVARRNHQPRKDAPPWKRIPLLNSPVEIG